MQRGLTLAVATAACLLAAGACSSAKDDPSGGDGSMGAATAGSGGPGDGGGNAGATASAGTGGDGVVPSAGAGGSQTTAGDGSAGASQGTGGETSEPAAGAGGAATSPEPTEMLDPDVDWEALSLVFPRMYSAHDGVHTFQVPARVDGATVELSGWQAVPSSAVLFDPDPNSEGGGVLITILEPVAEITIAASDGALGGTAPLYITEATPEDWEVGEARYHNGVEYDIPMINLLDLFNPSYVPPETPTNLACNNCHTTGAKYLEIQHTPSQAAYISDDDLTTILTQGMKPDGITYSVLPPELAFLYAEFHTWEASEDEIRGLIVYLRSLTPETQGDIVIPDNVILPMAMP